MTAEPDRVLTLDVRRPFTRADAIAAGIPPSALRGSSFRRIFRGVYVHRSLPPSPLIAVEAALLIHPPTAFASHASAARVYGVPIPPLPEEHVSVFAAGHRRARPGIRNHVVGADPPVVVVRNLRVSAPEQLFLELGSVLGLVDMVVVGDALVRLRRTTPEGLRQASAKSRSPAARRAAAYVRDRFDWPMETRLRMLLVLAGLPEPTIDHRILGRDGRVLYRF